MIARIPQVSIVIPAYNQAGYLPGAIRSVLNQTFQDFEIIVVDDGSTDETPEVMRSFGEAILPVSQENQGLAGARNTGLRLARASLVALLDSDDEWLPDYLEQMVALAGERPRESVFYCSVVYMDADGRSLPQLPETPVLPAEEMYTALLRHNFLVPSTILMRRTSVEDAGWFDPEFRRLQDWELWLRMLQAGYRFGGLPDRLVRYRVHSSSLSANPSTGHQAARRMAAKLFGPEQGSPEGWTWDKRRSYGGIYRYQAISSLQYQDDWQAASRFLIRALQVDPSLAASDELFYELVLGRQEMGQRGPKHSPDLAENGRRLLDALRRAPADSLAAQVLRKARGTACTALARAAYQAGNLKLARRWGLAGLSAGVGLAEAREMTGLVVKSLLGTGTLARLRQARKTF